MLNLLKLLKCLPTKMTEGTFSVLKAGGLCMLRELLKKDGHQGHFLNQLSQTKCNQIQDLSLMMVRNISE